MMEMRRAGDGFEGRGMGRRPRLLLVSALGAALVGPASMVGLPVLAQAPSASCSVAFMQASAPADTTIVSANVVQTPVPHCRVDGYVTTVNPGPNRNNFRLQLPEKQKWNNRFYFIGLGGSGGYVPTDSQTPAGNPIVAGFAVAGTDKGHTTDMLDWSFENDPAKALDNAHRGAHVTTVAAQQMTRAYYGVKKMYRYHTGCSGGGDMGQKAIQFYPNDYDGVLLGWIGGPFPDPKKNGVIRSYSATIRELTREPGAWISPAKRQLMQAKVLEACDAADGAKDEMIWDTRQCTFDFSRLKCSGADGPECLTQPEITTVQNILRDTAFPISNIASWDYVGPTPPPWDPSPTRENLRRAASAYVILNGWARTQLMQPDRDIIKNPLTEEEIKRIEAAKLNTFAYPGGFHDVTGFEKTGGKAIYYVGIGDPAFPHVGMEEWFRILTEKIGAERRDKFTRLYQVPGWGHCGGGTGPTDGVDRMLAELIDWVEKGKAPVGIKMHRGADRAQMMFTKAGSTTSGVLIPEAVGASRDFLVCPYPLVSVFDRSKANVPGAVYRAENWSCRRRT